MNRKIIYHLLALAVVSVWGFTFISSKILINAGLSPAQIFFIRFLIAYIGIWIPCIIQDRMSGSRTAGRLFSTSLKDELIFVVLGVTGGSLYFLTENTALVHTQACNAAFIVCSAPLLTILLTILVKKIAPEGSELSEGLQDVGANRWLALGTVMALSGMAMVVFNGYSLQLSPKGDALAFGAALCWAVYSIFMGQKTERYGALFATRKVFFYGLVSIVPVLIANGQIIFDPSILLQGSVMAHLLFLGVLASLVCFIAWNKVITVLGNISGTNYVYLNPIFTLIFAVIVLGESLTLVSGAGCLLILLGVIISSK